jgi:hypothetical protein
MPVLGQFEPPGPRVLGRKDRADLVDVREI